MNKKPKELSAVKNESNKEKIRTGIKLCTLNDTQRIETDVVLPDYCKEIKKLLKCIFIPGVHTVSLSGEKATSKGTGVLRIIYLGEGDVLDAFEKSIDLSSSVQIKDAPSDAVITANQKVDFINCRVTGQRKLSVSFAVTTVFDCHTVRNVEFVSSVEEKSVHTKKDKVTGEEICSFTEKTFDMSETVELKSEHPAAEKIVSCDGVCSLESKKFSSGKLLIKGEVRAEICYIPEKTENRLHKLVHTMPISQIVDTGEEKEECMHNVRLEIGQLSCNLKSDSSGAGRLIELSARVSTFVTAYMKKELEVITDCYCTECETETSYKEAEFNCPVREIKETLQHKGEIEFSSPVKEIVSLRCLETGVNVSCDENKTRGDCSALFGIIYLDENGVPGYCEKNLDFEFSYVIAKKCKEPYAEFLICVNSASASLSSSEKAEIQLDYTVCGKILCRYEKKILKELALLKDKPIKDKGVALTLYFAEKDESLWDIARHHNTTVELIMRENGIKNEKETREGMLLIPCI